MHVVIVCFSLSHSADVSASFFSPLTSRRSPSPPPLRSVHLSHEQQREPRAPELPLRPHVEACGGGVDEGEWSGRVAAAGADHHGEICGEQRHKRANALAMRDVHQTVHGASSAMMNRLVAAWEMGQSVRRNQERLGVILFFVTVLCLFVLPSEKCRVKYATTREGGVHCFGLLTHRFVCVYCILIVFCVRQRHCWIVAVSKSVDK